MTTRGAKEVRYICPRCQKIHPNPKGAKRRLCAVCVKLVSPERRKAFGQ